MRENFYITILITAYDLFSTISCAGCAAGTDDLFYDHRKYSGERRYHLSAPLACALEWFYTYGSGVPYIYVCCWKCDELFDEEMGRSFQCKRELEDF